MRARVRRRRRTPAGAATETWLAPVDVAGASAERFSFIAYLISRFTANSLQSTNNQRPRCSFTAASGLWGCFTETRLRDLCSHICLRRRKDLGYEKLPIWW